MLYYAIQELLQFCTKFWTRWMILHCNFRNGCKGHRPLLGPKIPLFNHILYTLFVLSYSILRTKHTFFPSSSSSTILAPSNSDYKGGGLLILLLFNTIRFQYHALIPLVMSRFKIFTKMVNLPIFSQFWLLTSFSVLVSKSAQFLPNIQRRCMKDIIN